MDSTTFLMNYGRVVSRTWEDAAYRDALFANPADTLAAAGIVAPEGLNIELLDIDPRPNGDPDAHVARWEGNEVSGVAQMFIPRKPTDFDPNDVVLNDELLEAVAGGTGDAVNSCCCCCPCCCCGSSEEMV